MLFPEKAFVQNYSGKLGIIGQVVPRAQGECLKIQLLQQRHCVQSFRVFTRVCVCVCARVRDPRGCEWNIDENVRNILRGENSRKGLVLSFESRCVSSETKGDGTCLPTFIRKETRLPQTGNNTQRLYLISLTLSVSTEIFVLDGSFRYYFFFFIKLHTNVYVHVYSKQPAAISYFSKFVSIFQFFEFFSVFFGLIPTILLYKNFLYTLRKSLSVYIH